MRLELGEMIFKSGVLFKGAKDIISFEILPRPPPSRANDNPWPTWPKVFKLDYGHEETMHVMGKDPRIFQISTKVSLLN